MSYHYKADLNQIETLFFTQVKNVSLTNKTAQKRPKQPLIRDLHSFLTTASCTSRAHVGGNA